MKRKIEKGRYVRTLKKLVVGDCQICKWIEKIFVCAIKEVKA